MKSDIYKYITSLNEFKFDFSLGRIKKVLRSFDEPQDSFRVVHITGSNGKGSVAAFLANALEANGIKTGMYTSPHLKDIRERIMINNEMAGRRVFEAEALRLKNRIHKLKTFLTYFEFLTVLAFNIFKREKVDMAVIEVGLGGRYDATNVAYRHKLLSIITSISLEHTDILGKNTLSILSEKEQIIGKGMAVCNVKGKKLKEHLKCEFGRRVIIPDDSYSTESVTSGKNGIKAVYRTNCGGEVSVMESKMTEPVQAENLKTVLCAIDILKSRDIKFNALATAGAIRATVLPGRMTRLKNGTYLSVAHNPEAVREALRALNVMHPGKKITYVFTAMKDKDTKTIFREMAKAGNVTLVLTTVDNRRACDIKDLEHSAAGAGVDFLIEPIPEKAVALARRIGKGGVTVIGGSFYLVNKFA